MFVKTLPFRRFAALVLASAMLTAGLGADCGGFKPPSEPTRASETGVPGLNTPDEILSRSEVSNAVQVMRNQGVIPNLEQGLDPPTIEGEYAMRGRHLYPDTGEMASGRWTWSNQTADNHIATNYSQTFQSGISDKGEIIRGSGNKFTVYSIATVTDRSNSGNVCTIPQSIFIVDGTKNADGSVSAVYCAVVLDGQEDCGLHTTMGQISLSPSGGSPPPAEPLARAVFGSPNISTTNCSITPVNAAFNYAEQQNNWRLTDPGTSRVTVSFNLSGALSGAHLRLTHLTSAYASCTGGGFAPIDIVVNGSVFRDGYDVAQAHGGTHGWFTDDWVVALKSGANTIEVVYQSNACTHYWIQELEVLAP